jgi:hypothetical protein
VPLLKIIDWVVAVSDVIYTLTYPIVLIYAIRIDAKNADMINPPENNMNPELIGTVNSVAEEKPLLSVDLDYGSIVRYPYNTETALRHVQTALEIDDLLEKKSHQHPTDHVMFIQGREMREGHLMVLYPGELLLRDYLRSVYVEVTTLLDIAYAIADGTQHFNQISYLRFTDGIKRHGVVIGAPPRICSFGRRHCIYN